MILGCLCSTNRDQLRAVVLMSGVPSVMWSDRHLEAASRMRAANHVMHSPGPVDLLLRRTYVLHAAG